MANHRVNYYTNPAFCQQSEFYNPTNSQILKTDIPSRREAPIGANAPSPNKYEHHGGKYNSGSQHRYEVVEMDEHEIEQNKRVISQLQMEEMTVNKNRYSSISPNKHTTNDNKIVAPLVLCRKTVDNGNSQNGEPSETHRLIIYRDRQPTRTTPSGCSPPIMSYQHEEIEVAPGRVHRYAMIPSDEEEFHQQQHRPMSPPRHIPQRSELSPERGRYAPVPVDDDLRQSYERYDSEHDQNGNTSARQTINRPIPAPRYGLKQQTRREIQNQEIQRIPNAVTSTPTKNKPQQNVISPTTPRKYNPIATQKLHELLSTPPRKTPQKSMQRTMSFSSRPLSPQGSATSSANKRYQSTNVLNTPRNYSRSPPPQYDGHIMSPRAQQKINYGLPPQQFTITSNPLADRSTAVIAPIFQARSPAQQSVYCETTYSGKSSSWMNLSTNFSSYSAQATLAVAALMMILCGALTSGLCFYMISVIGRKYYLDFGLVSGFTCLVLGLLGFRTRNSQWLPNRNYISGYIVISSFSLLTSGALLVLLAHQPEPGSALADVTAGAVCGTSALSLFLAATGTIASCCCKRAPPDNRVGHAAPGFTV